MQARLHNFPTQSLTPETKELADLGIERIAATLGTTVGAMPIIQAIPNDPSIETTSTAAPPLSIDIPNQIPDDIGDDCTPLATDPGFPNLLNDVIMTDGTDGGGGLVSAMSHANYASATHSEVSSLASLDDLTAANQAATAGGGVSSIFPPPPAHFDANAELFSDMFSTHH